MSGYLDIEVTAGSVKALPIAVTTVGATPVVSRSWYYGGTFIETTGAAAATVVVTNGGNFLDAFHIPSGESLTHWFGPMGISADANITVTVTSGSIQGVVYAGYGTS